MRWLAAFGRALDWLGRVLVGAALIGLLIIVSLQVVDRHFIDVPIAAPDAYARILLIWLTFIGFALAVRSGLAIRVDLMDHWLSPKVRVGLGLVFDLMKLGVVLLLIVEGWRLVQIGFDQSILGTDLTTAVPNTGLWLGSLMMFVFIVLAVLGAVTGRGFGTPDEDKTQLRAE